MFFLKANKQRNTQTSKQTNKLKKEQTNSNDRSLKKRLHISGGSITIRFYLRAKQQLLSAISILSPRGQPILYVLCVVDEKTTGTCTVSSRLDFSARELSCLLNFIPTTLRRSIHYTLTFISTFTCTFIFRLWEWH